MSRTVASKQRLQERKDKSDYYITPLWAVRQFLKAYDDVTGYVSYMQDQSYEDGPVLILDPCAGGDEEHPMSYPTVLEEWDINPITIDARPNSRAEIIADYLETDVLEKFDLIITNPPFIIIEDIIEKALSDCKDGGHVVMLARLNYFGAQKRAVGFQANMPKYVFVHSKRMGFDPAKPSDTDNVEYAHFVWVKGEQPDFTELRVILPPPKPPRKPRK